MESENIPEWCKPTLQGLAFWLAYKKQFYNGYTLSEGAIVGELAQGISSNIDSKSQILECERMYKDLHSSFDKLIRLDLAIGIKSTNQKENSLTSESLSFAVEVKRYENGWSLILEDLIRLKALKSKNNRIRCFLIVVAQDLRPQKLVSEKDYPINRHLKSDLNFISKVRTVKKAFSTKRKSKSGNYAILIEVL